MIFWVLGPLGFGFGGRLRVSVFCRVLGFWSLGFRGLRFRGFRAMMSMKTVLDRRAFNWSDTWHHQFDFASIFFVFSVNPKSGSLLDTILHFCYSKTLTKVKTDNF